MLGYLFYEHSNQFESALARAVTALRSVPKTSYYYEDALLGLGWTGLKARQWQDCIDAGSVLMKTSNKAVLRAEGALLNAYAFMMQKNFAGALPLLQGASRDLAAFALPSADSVDKAQKDYALTRSEYDVLSDKAKQYSLTTQSSYVIGQIDSLHLHQKSKKTTIDDYLVFSDELIRQKFFSRSLEVVSEDVEYALARAQKMAGLKGAVESQRKMQQKQEAIDSEIDRLKKEMQELNKDRTPFEKVNPKKEQPQPEPAGSESGADTGEPAE